MLQAYLTRGVVFFAREEADEYANERGAAVAAVQVKAPFTVQESLIVIDSVFAKSSASFLLRAMPHFLTMLSALGYNDTVNLFRSKFQDTLWKES
jgi:hypothetical protein